MQTSKNAILNIWAVFFYFFAQWLVTILLTKLMGYEVAGQYSLAISFANMFSFIGMFGVRSFQISDVHYKYTDGQYFALRIVTAALALVLFSITLSIQNYSTELVMCCIAVMSFKVLECVDDCTAGVMQRNEKYLWIAISYTIKGILPLILFIIGLLLTQSLLWAVISMALGYFTVQITYDLSCLRRLCGKQGRFDFKGISAIAIQCFPLMLTAVLDSALVYLPRDAVEKALGAESLGYYSTISIVVVVLSTLGAGLWAVIAPKLSLQIIEKRWNDLRKTTNAIFSAIAVGAVLVVILGNMVGPLFFNLLFGEEILAYMYLLTPVLLNAVLLLVNSFYQYIFIPMNKRSLLLLSNATAVLVCMLIESTMVNQLGILGACLGLTYALTARMLFLTVSYFICLVRYNSKKKPHDNP